MLVAKFLSSYKRLNFKQCIYQTSLIVRGREFTIGEYYQLPVKKVQEIPLLPKTETSVLTKNSSAIWSRKPFDPTHEILLPIFSLTNGQYIGSVASLDQEIFNQHLRRDIVHRLTVYTTLYDQKILHPTMRLKDVAASGKKEEQDKVDQNIDKPGRKKGVKAHGRVARILRIKLPKKIRLQGIKIGLTAALYEGRIRIIENEKIDSPKTKSLMANLNHFVDNSGKGPIETILCITGVQQDENFIKAATNIKFLKTITSDKVNIMNILGTKWILITQAGLEQLIGILREETIALYTRRVRNLPKPVEQSIKQLKGEISKEEEKVVYNPQKPLELKFRVLKEYQEEYEKLKKEGKLQEYIKAMPLTRKYNNRINSVEVNK